MRVKFLVDYTWKSCVNWLIINVFEGNMRSTNIYNKNCFHNKRKLQCIWLNCLQCIFSHFSIYKQKIQNNFLEMLLISITFKFCWSAKLHFYLITPEISKLMASLLTIISLKFSLLDNYPKYYVIYMMNILYA